MNRKDGLIEFKGFLINPRILDGTVVWSLDKVQAMGLQQVSQISLQILNEWRNKK